MIVTYIEHEHGEEAISLFGPMEQHGLSVANNGHCVAAEGLWRSS